MPRTLVSGGLSSAGGGAYVNVGCLMLVCWEGLLG